jgi:hypothetical protein
LKFLKIALKEDKIISKQKLKFLSAQPPIINIKPTIKNTKKEIQKKQIN